MNVPAKQENKALTPKAMTLKAVSERLDALLEIEAKAFPSGFNKTRFLQNCITVLRDTKDIELCDPISISRAMIKGAYLGLDFFNKECYAIAYGKQINFQTDYKGEVKLIMKYSIRKLRDLYAKLVREGDDLEISIVEGRQIVNFKPKPFNDGAITGAFAVAFYADGGMQVQAMSKAEIEDVRNKYSKAPNSTAWKNSFGEMCQKVVTRRLRKWIPVEFENSQQDKAFKEGADEKDDKELNRTPKVADPFAEPEVMDAVFSSSDQGEDAAPGKTAWEKEDETKNPSIKSAK